MNNIIFTNVMVLAAIAFCGAVLLYWISKKYAVVENVKIDEIEALLPSANCGACGRAGCRDFANACVKANAEEFANLFCPVGGNEVMSNVAKVLGYEMDKKTATVAVLKCNGNCENAPNRIAYNGTQICRLVNKIAVGQSGCPDGCLKFGDCVKVCKFGALSIDELGIPKVDKTKCTSCAMCVNICPRSLFEIRPLDENGKKVYVACSNKQKGALARKTCKVACIACGKCAKICDEIKIERNLSYIPASVDVQKFGAELKAACPTGAIIND